MSAVIHIEGPNEGEIFTAATFLDYMRKSAPHWWEGAENSFDCPWVFRRQSDAGWSLIPTAARPNFEGVPEFKEIVQQLKLELESSVENWESFDPFYRDKFVRLFAHEKCIRKFLHLANDIGKRFLTLQPLTWDGKAWLIWQGLQLTINLTAIQRFMVLSKHPIFSLLQHHVFIRCWPARLSLWRNIMAFQLFFLIGHETP